MGEIDDFGVEHDDEELQALLSGTPSPKKPRYYCAGFKRKDERTGKPRCEYKAYDKWYGYCLGCNQPYACLPIKRAAHAGTSFMTLGKKTMDAHKATVYYSTGMPELDRVLGGGIVYGKVVMVGAPRGSGKTTTLLQMAKGFCQDERKAYFGSGEMDGHTNVDYAKRLGIESDNIMLFCDSKGLDIEQVFDQVLQFGARFMLLDALQTCIVSDMKKADIGSPAMVTAVINMLSSFCQAKQRACYLISHLNKDGDYAGTETGQHMVDVLLRIDNKYAGRNESGKPIDTMLREFSLEGKSRQGSANVTAMMELTAQGMMPPSLGAMRMLNEYRKIHLV